MSGPPASFRRRAGEMAESPLFAAPAQDRRKFSSAEIAPILIFLAFALVPAAAPFGPQSYLLGLFIRVMIFAIAAIGLDLIVGYGALVSFGHAAFVGLGAYAVGILAAHGVDEALISLPVALAVSAL